MNNTFKFRTGKFRGKSYAWVLSNHPNYIEWVLEARPEMLRERISAKPVIPSYLKEENENAQHKLIEPLTPNKNFENEGPLSMNKNKIRLEITKVKIGLFARLSKETNPEGSVKYNTNQLIDIIFDSPEDSNIKDKLKTRING